MSPSSMIALFRSVVERVVLMAVVEVDAVVSVPFFFFDSGFRFCSSMHACTRLTAEARDKSTVLIWSRDRVRQNPIPLRFAFVGCFDAGVLAT